MIAEVIYVLCTLTSALCAVLLYRGWRTSGSPLLFWSCLCFVGFAMNNALLFVDRIIIPHGADLSVPRLVPAVLGVGALLYGLIREVE